MTMIEMGFMIETVMLMIRTTVLTIGIVMLVLSLMDMDITGMAIGGVALAAYWPMRLADYTFVAIKKRVRAIR